MKKLSLLLLLVIGSGFVGGCGGTPAYTRDERFAQIKRNFEIDNDQIADDIDHMLLLRPSGTLSFWNIYHRE